MERVLNFLSSYKTVPSCKQFFYQVWNSRTLCEFLIVGQLKSSSFINILDVSAWFIDTAHPLPLIPVVSLTFGGCIVIHRQRQPAALNIHAFQAHSSCLMLSSCCRRCSGLVLKGLGCKSALNDHIIMDLQGKMVTNTLNSFQGVTETMEETLHLQLLEKV